MFSIRIKIYQQQLPEMHYETHIIWLTCWKCSWSVTNQWFTSPVLTKSITCSHMRPLFTLLLWWWIKITNTVDHGIPNHLSPTEHALVIFNTDQVIVFLTRSIFSSNNYTQLVKTCPRWHIAGNSINVFSTSQRRVNQAPADWEDKSKKT